MTTEYKLTDELWSPVLQLARKATLKEVEEIISEIFSKSIDVAAREGGHAHTDYWLGAKNALVVTQKNILKAIEGLKEKKND